MGHFETLIEGGMYLIARTSGLQKLINNSLVYYHLRCQKSIMCRHPYSWYRMIILKSPERVLIPVSGEIGVQYMN